MRYPEVETPFSEKAVTEKNVTVIFPDAIIVDNDYRLVNASAEILEQLQYRRQELLGAALDVLTRNNSVSEKIRETISQCFSGKLTLPLFDRGGSPVFFEISGFQLSLISNMSDRILLRLRNLSETFLLNEELEETREELDSFIYRSSHELRGPVATIRGLVQLLQIRKDDSELEQLVNLIDIHASALDARLGRLLYLENSASSFEPLNSLNTHVLRQNLLSLVEEKIKAGNVALNFHSAFREISGINEQLFFSLLKNLLFYLVKFPQHEEIQISVRMEASEKQLKVNILSNCWSNDCTPGGPRPKGGSYSNTLKNPDLVHYYAALKVCQKLRSHIHFSVNHEGNQHEITVGIPLRHT